MKERIGCLGLIIFGLFILFSLIIIPMELEYKSSELQNIAIILIIIWIILISYGISCSIIEFIKNRKSYKTTIIPKQIIETKSQSNLFCKRCNKSLNEIPLTGGVISGALLGQLALNSPYECKSCGTIFCVDCMSFITKNNASICPVCRKIIGW